MGKGVGGWATVAFSADGQSRAVQCYTISCDAPRLAVQELSISTAQLTAISQCSIVMSYVKTCM